MFAITIRVVWGVTRFQDDVLNVNFGDYDLYEYGAEHLLTAGDFTDSTFLVRPPLFSLMIAALGMNRLAVLVVNAIIGGCITPLTYGIARRLGLSEQLALGAAFLSAVDAVAIVYGAALLDSIALGNFFAILMMLFLLMIPDAASARAALGYGAAAGLALVISALARPEIYLIWTGLGMWLLVIARQQWRAVVVYALVSVIGLGVWTVHNGVVFGNYTVSTVSGFTMAFYRAASVERIGSGDDIETVYMNITYRVEEKLGNNPDDATPDTRWGYHAAAPDVQQALVDVSREIFLTYPLIYVATIPLGFARMYALMPPFLDSNSHYVSFVWNWLMFIAATGGLGGCSATVAAVLVCVSRRRVLHGGDAVREECGDGRARAGGTHALYGDYGSGGASVGGGAGQWQAASVGSDDCAGAFATGRRAST